MIDHPMEKDRSEIASETGFTGTFSAFIEWLQGALIYGRVKVHEPAPNDFGRTVTRVETVTGGYSSDERLLGRLRRSLFLSTSWVLSERGGLVVYEFNEWLTGDEEREWLSPDRGQFETVARARTLRVIDREGGVTELPLPDGAVLCFFEPDRYINEPAGVLEIHPWVSE